MRRQVRYPRLVALIILLLCCMGGATVLAAAPSGATLWPPSGATLASTPASVQVRLPGPATGAAKLQVLDDAGKDQTQGAVQWHQDTISRRLADLPPGLYTVLWSDGSDSGAGTFTIWHGGPLPPQLQRAAMGGPTLTGPGTIQALLAALALLEAMVLVGGITFGHRRCACSLLRRAAVLTGAAALGVAVLHTAAALGIRPIALLHSPLAWPVLRRGVAAADLLATAAAAGAFLLAGLVPEAATACGALALGALCASVPILRAGGPWVWPAAWATAVGAGVYGGAWPFALRAASLGEPAPAARLVGLGAALVAGAPLVVAWPPLHHVPDVLAAATALAAILLGHPGTRSGTGLVAAIVASLALGAYVAPSLVAASPLAGRGSIPTPARWAYQATGVTHLALAVAPMQVGVNVIQVTGTKAESPSLLMTVTSATHPELVRQVTLTRIKPGVYATQSDALSQPGPWEALVGGSDFILSVGARPLTLACPLGLAGMDAAVARLPAPARALTVDGGDGNIALAATAGGIYATQDGGLHWQAVGGPDDATALAVGLHGQWYAATPRGLYTTLDGGATWGPVAGVVGAVQALASPLYPQGAPVWAAAAGNLDRGITELTNQGLETPWSVAGSAPAQVQALLALSSGKDYHFTTELLAASADGLWVSTDAGGRWQQAPSPTGAVTLLAAGADALWAAGPAGLWTAAAPAGPWAAVQLPGAGTPAITGLATGGTAGADVVATVAGRGIFRSPDGGHTWSPVGCPQTQIVASAGTYSRGAPTGAGAPLGYIADARGEIFALLPPAISNP